MSVLLPGRDLYAFCFCKHPDLLSQWRAYATGGGYAIGFETDPLSHALIRQGYSLFPVDYGPGQSLHLCEADLRNLCRALDRCVDELQTHEEVLLAGAAEWLKIVLVSHVATMKHPGFAEEDEWRILITWPTEMPSVVEFREGRDALIPYYKAYVSDVQTSKATYP